MVSLMAALSPVGWLTLAFQGVNVAEMAADGDTIGLVSTISAALAGFVDAMFAAAERW